MIQYYSQQPVILYEDSTGSDQVVVFDEIMLYARWYEYWLKITGTLSTNPRIILTVYPKYNDIIAENQIAQISITPESLTTGDYCIILPLTICIENKVDKFKLKFTLSDILNGKIKKITRIAR